MTTLGPTGTGTGAGAPATGAILDAAAVEGRFRPPVYWSAIVGGVAAALITHFLLNLLGVGVGAALIDPQPGVSAAGAADAAQTGGTAAYVWWAVSGILSSFVGGWIAGYLTAQAGRGNEMLHGFFAWGVTTLVILLVMAGALGAASRTVGNIAGPVASQVDRLGQMGQARGQMQQGVDAQGNRTFTFSGPDGRRTTVTEAQLAEQADRAADAVAQGALWSFAALVLGAAAAVFGAGAGRRARLPDGRIPIGAESAPTNMKAAERPQR